MIAERTLADAFDRGGFATRLADEIVARSDDLDLFNGPVTVNLNSPYGSGKTTFVKLLQEELGQRGHLTIYFDAWQHDLVEEPLSGFISAISHELNELSGTSKQLLERAKTLATAASKIVARVGAQAALKWLSGMTVDQVKTLINSDDEIPSITDEALKEMFAKNESPLRTMDAFRCSLDDYIKTIANRPLIVVVDELDRCRPSYAIRLLETIKHLFNVTGISFVVATNTAQLAHCVRAIYGQGFEAELYLKRFFTLEVQLPIPDRIPFVLEQLKSLRVLDGFRFANKVSPNELGWAIESVVLAFDLSLRDLVQLMPNLKSIRLHRSERKLDIYWMFFLLALAWKKPEVFLRWAQLAARGRDSPSSEEVERALDARKFEPRTKCKLEDAMQRDLEGYGTDSIARDYVRTAFAPLKELLQEFNQRERNESNKYNLRLNLIGSIISEFKHNANPLLAYFDFVQHLGVVASNSPR